MPFIEEPDRMSWDKIKAGVPTCNALGWAILISLATIGITIFSVFFWIMP